MKSKKLIVALSGASGVIYGIRTLEALKNTSHEVHLVITNAAKITLNEETNYKLDQVKSLSNFYHAVGNIGASIASGSFNIDGMIIIPCSINTMSAIASGISSSLITRAADVVLKERKKLILAVRETPLHLGHLRNMVKLTEMGAIIAPISPIFYTFPKNLDDIINHYIGKILNLFDIELNFLPKWQGLSTYVDK